MINPPQSDQNSFLAPLTHHLQFDVTDPPFSFPLPGREPIGWCFRDFPTLSPPTSCRMRRKSVPNGSVGKVERNYFFSVHLNHEKATPEKMKFRL
ncbi:hypothetical protein JTE90_013296 [Oedothorax gibbosus]|uniref:Uncharacterized protein n=1 Tax=Oedothorax gibbosus TaxID=931172 RepID=A0AAV6VCZ0_9ARAC|nr:hypothetical protein JTE90_013296 [Oedothorax gibbosus]